MSKRKTLVDRILVGLVDERQLKLDAIEQLHGEVKVIDTTIDRINRERHLAAVKKVTVKVAEATA